MESPQTTQTSFGLVTSIVNYRESQPKRMCNKSSKTSKVAKTNNNNINSNNTMELRQSEQNVLALATQPHFQETIFYRVRIENTKKSKWNFCNW